VGIDNDVDLINCDIIGNPSFLYLKKKNFATKLDVETAIHESFKNHMDQITKLISPVNNNPIKIVKEQPKNSKPIIRKIKELDFNGYTLDDMYLRQTPLSQNGVRNLTEEELCSNKLSLFEFDDIFDRMLQIWKAIPKMNRPMCFAHHDKDGLPGKQVNMMMIFKDNNGEHTKVINGYLKDHQLKKFIKVPEIGSQRIPGKIFRNNIFTKNNIIKYIPHEFIQLKTKKDHVNAFCIPDYEDDGHYETLKLELAQSVCVEIALKSFKIDYYLQ